MPTYVAVVVLAAYVSLAAELTIFRVQSVASSRAIWAPRQELVSTYSVEYRRLFALSRPVKALLFVVPLVVVYGVFLYPLLVIVGGPDPFDDYLYTPSRASNAVAVAAILAGRLIAAVSALTIRRHNRQTGDSFHLHTSGVFRWSRNPGLIGMYVFAGGLWAAAPSAGMLIGILLYVAYMHFKIRMEEDFLENKFGDRYADYRLQTGRYFR